MFMPWKRNHGVACCASAERIHAVLPHKTEVSGVNTQPNEKIVCKGRRSHLLLRTFQSPLCPPSVRACAALPGSTVRFPPQSPQMCQPPFSGMEYGKRACAAAAFELQKTKGEQLHSRRWTSCRPWA